MFIHTGEILFIHPYLFIFISFVGERKLFGGYRITPKFCKASKLLPKTDPRSGGPTICMFQHECSQRHGEVVGACMDGYVNSLCSPQFSFDESSSFFSHKILSISFLVLGSCSVHVVNWHRMKRSSMIITNQC